MTTCKLTTDDILLTVRALMGDKENCQFTVNDLKEPTSQVFIPILSEISERILDVPIPKSLPFAAAQILDHPHLYEEHTLRLRLLKCLKLCCKYALVPFPVDMGDLIMPERKRTRIIMNCLINYLRHCMQNDEKLHDIEKKLTVLRKESSAKEERLRRLQDQLAALEEERQSDEPEMFRLTDIAAQLQADLEHLNLHQSELRANLLKLKESSAAQQVKLEGQRVDNAKSKQASEDQRAHIVVSPDRRKAQIAELGQEVAELRRQAAAQGERRQNCLHHRGELQKLVAEVSVQREQVTKLSEQQQGMVGMERHNTNMKTDMDDLRLHLKRLTLQMQSLKEEQEQEMERFTRQQQHVRMQCESVRQRIQQHQEQEQQIMADVEHQVCESHKYLDACQEVESEIADLEEKQQEDLGKMEGVFDQLVSQLELVTAQEKEVFESFVAANTEKPTE
eukprot:scpid52541/ scgid7626/ 